MVQFDTIKFCRTCILGISDASKKNSEILTKSHDYSRFFKNSAAETCSIQVIHPSGQVVTQLQPQVGGSAAASGGSSLVYSMNKAALAANSRGHQTDAASGDSSAAALSVLAMKGNAPVQISSAAAKSLSKMMTSRQ